MAVKSIFEEDLRTRIEIAWDPTTDPRVLSSLAEDPNEVVRKFVAENPCTPSAIVEKLIVDQNLTDCDLSIIAQRNDLTEATYEYIAGKLTQ